MKKIICFFKGHKRDPENTYIGVGSWCTFRWEIQCIRCKKWAKYESPRARLIGEEMRLGFDGK